MVQGAARIQGSSKPVGHNQLSSLRQVPEHNENTFSTIINSDETKKLLNYAANGGATLVNLFTFINGNWPIFDSLQDKLESFSEIMAKIATGTQGLILAADTWKKRNLIPLLGFILEVPIAIFSSGYNLWLWRGLSQGLGQFLGVIDRREVVDKKGNPILKNGKVQTIGGDFNNGGKGVEGWKEWMKSVSTTLKEVPKLTRELIENPSRIKNMSHGLYLASVGQIAGTVTALLGLNSIGAIVRDLFGTLVDFSLITDKKVIEDPTNQNILNNAEQGRAGNLDRKPSKFNFKSLFVWAGFTWILAAVVDAVKRIPFISDKFNCLTNLSLTSDRGASLLYTMENLRIKNIKKQREEKTTRQEIIGVKHMSPAVT